MLMTIRARKAGDAGQAAPSRSCRAGRGVAHWLDAIFGTERLTPDARRDPAFL